MKKIKIMLMLLLSVTSMASISSNLDFVKESHKFNILSNVPSNGIKLLIGERLEADAILEISKEGYYNYRTFSNRELLTIPHSEEIILIMPRIDILENNLTEISKLADDVFVFLMDKDIQEGPYGDRSYETYLLKGLDKKLPLNMKVFRLNSKLDSKYFDVDYSVIRSDIFKEIQRKHNENSKYTI